MGRPDPLGLNEDPPPANNKTAPTGVPGYWGPDGKWVAIDVHAPGATTPPAAPAPTGGTSSGRSSPNFPLEDAPVQVDENGGGYTSLANRDKTRAAENPAGLISAAPKAAPDPNTNGVGIREQPTKPAPPQVLQTTGSGGMSVGGIVGSYIQDTGRQEQAMRDEKAARTGPDEPPVQTWGGQDADSQAQGLVPKVDQFGGLARAETEQSKAFEAARTAMASEKQDQMRNAFAKQQEILDRYQQLTDAYAKGTVDPDKWWHDKNVPEKIASVAGAVFLGMGGRPEAALNYANAQIDRSIAIQQGDLERTRVAAGHYQNLYDLALNHTKNVQEAYDFTRSVYLDNVIADSARALAPYKNDITKAEIDQYIAMLREQRDMTLAKFMAKTGSGGAAADGWLTTDSKSFVTDPRTGQQYLLNNPTMAPHVDAQLDAYTRIKSALEQGKDVIKLWQSNSPADWLEAYNRGQVIDNSIFEAEAKLSSSRGMPTSTLGVIKGQKPTFASPSSRVTGSRIEALEGLLDQWTDDTLRVNNARPFDTRTGPGLGKKAGELTTYARPSAEPAQAPQTQAPAPAQKKYGSFTPDQTPAGP